MKNAFIISLMLVASKAISQTAPAPAPAPKPQPTHSFTIIGDVKASPIITFADLKKYKEVVIGDVAITNHLGEKKSDSKGMKGVLLKDVLEAVPLNAESPKLYSQYYYVCKANDGYIVVYSWNELFNTATGNSAYIITEKDGKSADTLDDSILMISTKDFKTGRRNLKSLVLIEAKKAD